MAAHMAEIKTHGDGKKSKKFKGKKKGFRPGPKLKKWQLEVEEAKKLQTRYDSINPPEISTFEDFPLCSKTRMALRMANFKAPTEIQRMSIGLALKGHDVLGAAKTGSGKTLAFLIPILECLFRNRWSAEDGLGALIISPTRELAYQTFEVLCKVGKKHDFSAGLIIGGKDLQTEMERISRTNIVVCTPGRLLQHMDQTVNFECANLQMLVLDEADRILDLGFEKTMNAIIENLPPERQTLLFSATQTKSVRDLARLSLKDPKYVAVHQHHEYSTPSQLEQSYVVCDLDQKADLLYSFIRNHREQKILVFMASCKQVKYMFEVFCKLRPGTTIMALYGSLHQLRRVAIYNEFCKRECAVLLATDIAARGLDFPAVNWVVQLDCPEDANTYIHRAGRTARYEKGGESLLILLPSEEDEMVRLLEEKKIPIQKIQVNPNKKMTIQRKLESYCAENHELKQVAQRCFIAYIKSVYLMKNKKVFDVQQLELDKFALSLGLAVPPRVRFLQREEKRKQLKQQQQKQKSKDVSRTKNANDANLDEVQSSTAKVKDRLSGSVRGGFSEESENDSSNAEEDEGDEADSEDDVEGFKESMLKALEGSSSQKINTGTVKDSGNTDKSNKARTKRMNDPKYNKQESQKSSTKISQSDSEKSSAGDSSDEEQSDDGGVTKEQKTGAPVASFHGNSDGEEDDGDLFTVKTDVFGIKDKSKAFIDSDEEFLQADKRVKEKKRDKEESKKSANKIKLAKKLHKKKLAVNTKMVFGDEGEAVQQWPPCQKTVTKTEGEEEEEYEGGINIEKAKELMSEEDKHDKQAFRQRIKEKHRVQRLKAKEERRKGRSRKDEQDEDDPGVPLDFTGGNEAFDPDTLPDPESWENDDGVQEAGQEEDAKHKMDDGREEHGDGSGEAGEQTSKEKSRSKKKLKRKHAEKETQARKKSKKKKMKQEEDGEEYHSSLTLAEDEELALHILGNR